jgi:hypothetical protein
MLRDMEEEICLEIEHWLSAKLPRSGFVESSRLPIVICEICSFPETELDDLEHVPRTPADQREEQFARLRESRKFLAREFEGNPPASSCAASTLGPEDAAA